MHRARLKDASGRDVPQESNSTNSLLRPQEPSYPASSAPISSLLQPRAKRKATLLRPERLCLLLILLLLVPGFIVLLAYTQFEKPISKCHAIVKPPAPPDDSSSNTPQEPNDDESGLAEHNWFRAQYGADALVWNKTTANSAALHASNCIFAHDGKCALSFTYKDALNLSSHAEIWGPSRKERTSAPERRRSTLASRCLSRKLRSTTTPSQASRWRRVTLRRWSGRVRLI